MPNVISPVTNSAIGRREMTSGIKTYMDREIASMTANEMTEYMCKAYLEYYLAVAGK